MDAFFSGLDSRLRCSVKVADSIMMGLVNAAMEDAYKKSLWKDGDLERLFQKLRFAELAIMQLEWCLRFVRGEMEGGSADDCHEQLLDDLLETRDRIQVRVDEAELAVADKDRDYMRRKHAELASLRRESSVPADSGCANDYRREVEEGCAFGELKRSVDRQMARMRVRLEDARSTLTALMQKVSGEASPMARLQEAGHEGDGVKGLSGFYSMAQLLMEFQEMILDAGAVRDSVASSFDVMGRFISSLREAMDEQQWLANVEKEIYGTVVEGFLQEIIVGSPVLKDSSPGEESQPTEYLKGKTGEIQLTRPATVDSGQHFYSEEPSISHEEVEMLIEEKIDLEIRFELQYMLHTSMFRDLVRKLAVLDVQKVTEEDNESDIRVELLCEIYTTLFEDLVSKLGAEYVEHLIRTYIKDEVEAVVLAETLNEWKSLTEMVYNQRFITKENDCIPFGEPKKELDHNINNVLRSTEKNTCINNLGRFSKIENVAQIHIMKMQTSRTSEDNSIRDSYQVLLDKEILSNFANCDSQDFREGDLQIETSIDKGNIFNPVNDNMEQGLLEQQEHRKLLRGDAISNLSIPPEEVNIKNDDMTLILKEKHQSTYSNSMLAEEDQFELRNPLVPFTSIQGMFMNFEDVTCEKIEAATLRLRDLKTQQGNLVEHMSALKGSEYIYRSAFNRRCHDLQTAEAEVDLLGDEVELLLGLLRKTYKALDHYSRVLQHYLGIREILKLLGKELTVRHQI